MIPTSVAVLPRPAGAAASGAFKSRGERAAWDAPEVGVAMATPAGRLCVSAAADDPASVVRCVEQAFRPRWVIWSNATAVPLVDAGVRVATCWDIAAVQRLIFGGWRADPARVWAQLHDLALDAIPSTGPLDLFSHAAYGESAPDDPIRGDGYLRPDWVSGGWSTTPERLARWAELASIVAERQQTRLVALHDRPRAVATARAESAAELLCAELSVDGLPMDRAVAEELIAAFVGGRPCSEAEAAEQRARRRACASASGTRSCRLRRSSLSTWTANARPPDFVEVAAVSTP